MVSIGGTQDKLTGIADDSTEVRAAALYALGTFMGASGSADPNKQGGGGTGTMLQLEERVHFRMEVAVATGATIAIKDNASPMCRKELLMVISCLVKEWRGYFVIRAWLYWEEDRKWRSGTTGSQHPLSSSHLYDGDVTSQAVAEWLEACSEDDLLSCSIVFILHHLPCVPRPLCGFISRSITNAQTILYYITALLLASPFKHLDSASLGYAPAVPLSRRGSPQLGCPPLHPISENELERSPHRSDTMTNIVCRSALP